MINVVNVEYHTRGDLEKVAENNPAMDRERTLIQVFSGRCEIPVLQDLVDNITSVFPGVPLIGTTTSGEIFNGDVTEQKIIISFSFFEHTTVHSRLVAQNDNLEKAGRDLGEFFLPFDPEVCILFGCGLKNKRTIDGSPMISTVQDILPSTVIAGAQAGDNGDGVITYVFTEKGITDCGTAGACLSGSQLVVGNEYNLAWVPIGKTLTITKAVGPRVYAIDNMSPYELYTHYLGHEVADGLPLSAADFPLIIERDGIPLAIHAIGVNDDGSFEYIHSFHTGEQLRFGFCHAGLLALGARKTYEKISSKPVEAIFIYTCVSRRWILGSDVQVEINPLAALAPCSGFFAYGEYFSHRSGKGYFFSQTMTVLSLREKTPEKGDMVPIDFAEPFRTPEETKQLKTLRALHRLVETSAREIESINAELSGLIRKDSLTGLYNRRHLDERFQSELNRAVRNSSPLSLVMFDVDFFKQYNDSYGHPAGDSCLRGIALETIRHLRRDNDLAVRYGGEEFICLLPDTDFDGASEVAEELRSSIENLRRVHRTSSVSDYVTVSLGVLTVEKINRGTTQKELIERCDSLLYQAKREGRNRICSQRKS